MTDVIDVTVYQAECAICGHESEAAEVEAFEEEIPRDLDLRFAELGRYNVQWWVQMCPFCGYAAERIYEEAPEGAKAVVWGEEFRSLFDATSELDPIVRAYRHAAYISTQLNDLERAFWFTLYQAWIFDDIEQEASAMATRLVAASFMKRIHDRGEQVVEQEGFDTLLEVDLLRRAAKFAQAALACQNGLTLHHDEFTKEILVFQINLCEQKDRRCHTMEEVFHDWDAGNYDA